ncbi:protein phosphatase 1 regulatory subunit 3A [Triplophysa dalaica]|uniref:protein phosphatase 1 regulatory subunit 3A n=1 Tax=Triplophysa dalaica TaxID=1582913 RepID=UPI0024DF357C|nr:protein phosphatase 1 regulatory subunit 3A [Triplophysa dalaica]
MRQKQEKDTMESIEDEFEEVEPEPPPAAVRRKVSFADAFGLDLVSVKEFDHRDSSVSDDLVALVRAERKVGEEFYLSCLFAPPASDHELKTRLQEQTLELESIELLPGSTTIRGIIRVLNLCFHKAVYVHTSLDGWQSHFDLLAEYVPGSSDGETDRFSFWLMLTPPLEAEGTRVEFCLRYESAVGTFWANNRGMNYVLFCHQRRRTDAKEKGKEEERDKDKLSEENNHRGIRSCLKTISKKICMEESPTGTNGEISDQITQWVGSNKEGMGDKDSELTSPKSLLDCCRPLEDRRRKRRAALLACAQHYFSQKEMEPQIVDIGKSTTDWSSVPNKDNQQGDSMDTPPIIMHNQIPLLSLDWGGNTTSSTRAKPNDVCNGISVANDADEDQTKSACEAWDDFLSATDTTTARDDMQDQERISNVGQSESNIGVTPSDGEELSNVHMGVEKETCQSGRKGSVDSSPTLHSTETPKYSGSAPSTWQDPDKQLWEEPRVKLTTRSDHGWEPEESESGNSKEISSGPREEAENALETTTPNSKGGDGISPDTSKVKENTHGVVGDTLTFTGIRDEPLADRQTEGSSEKEDLNKASGLEKKDSGETRTIRKVQDEPVDQSMRSWLETLLFHESDSCTSNTKHSSEQKDEERRFEPVRENQGLEAEDDLHTLPIIHLSLMGGDSRMLSWWGDVWSLGHVTRALVYSVVLLMVFVTAYL